MIQRIQSVFLLLVSAGFFSLFGFPFATTDASASNALNDQVFEVMDNPILLVLAALGGVLALINIFLFRNRKRQMHIGILLIVLGILLGIAAFVLFMQESQELPKQATVHDAVGTYIPFVIIAFSVAANYFIRKDEKTVRSMDRLR